MAKKNSKTSPIYVKERLRTMRMLGWSIWRSRQEVGGVPIKDVAGYIKAVFTKEEVEAFIKMLK